MGPGRTSQLLPSTNPNKLRLIRVQLKSICVHPDINVPGASRDVEDSGISSSDSLKHVELSIVSVAVNVEVMIRSDDGNISDV